MHLRSRLNRVLCGTGLALALAVVPATWALSPAHGAKHAAAVSATQGQVDINTATEAQLKAVPGIGDVYAKRIVQNRPYNSKDQLVSKGVMSQGVYDKIKGKIVAHRMKK